MTRLAELLLPMQYAKHFPILVQKPQKSSGI